LVCGAFGTFAHQAYAARLRGQLNSNVRPHKPAIFDIMKRRTALLTATAILPTRHASAGVMDWYNGVKLGATLPEFDTEYLGTAPSSDRKLLLIDFWATWCAPCRDEFPHLNELHARFAGQGLVVIGLTQETKSVAQSFLPKVKIDYTIGAAGTKPLQKLLGIKAIPYAILVSNENKTVWRGQARSLSANEVERRLKSAA